MAHPFAYGLSGQNIALPIHILTGADETLHTLLCCIRTCLIQSVPHQIVKLSKEY